MKERILKIARSMAKRDGLVNLTHIGLCQEASINPGSFSYVTGMTFTELLAELGKDPLLRPSGGASGRGRIDSPGLRADHIIACGLELAERDGFSELTRDRVAEYAGVSGALISKYFPMERLRYAIMTQAIERRIIPIAAEGWATGHPAAAGLDNTYISEIMAYLVNRG